MSKQTFTLFAFTVGFLIDSLWMRNNPAPELQSWIFLGLAVVSWNIDNQGD